MAMETVNKVILFYRYVLIENPELLCERLNAKCKELSLMGRLLISSEGLNGTLGGSIEKVEEFMQFMISDERFEAIDWKESASKGEVPFLSLSVRTVPEIISTGQRAKDLLSSVTFDPNSFGGLSGTGYHLAPAEFHSAVQERNVVLLDIRNDFEYNIGHFDKAVKIGTYTYAETFDKFNDVLAAPEEEDRKILLYCTGGIRCEKASAFLKSRGYKDVCQLKGGIHRYLESYPDGGRFQGKNFVFDSRVAMAAEKQEGDEVQGHCVDCDSLFDSYSGHIVCTVCRYPTLVCLSCRANNSYPDEYYCARHREMKGLYCTMLANYSEVRLEEQKAGLEKVLKINNEASHSKSRRRTIRKQLTKLDKELEARRRQRGGEEVEGPQCSSLALNPQTRGGWGFWKS